MLELLIFLLVLLIILALIRYVAVSYLPIDARAVDLMLLLVFVLVVANHLGYL